MSQYEIVYAHVLDVLKEKLAETGGKLLHADFERETGAIELLVLHPKVGDAGLEDRVAEISLSGSWFPCETPVQHDLWRDIVHSDVDHTFGWQKVVFNSRVRTWLWRTLRVLASSLAGMFCRDDA